MNVAKQLEKFPNLVTMFLTRAREKGDKPFLSSKHDGGWADGRVAGGENPGDTGVAVVVDDHHALVVELAAELGWQGTWRESGRVEQSGAVVARAVGKTDPSQPAVL